jgi:hypothetical protein
MAIMKVSTDGRKPPNQWQSRKFADVGASEEFVKQFLELDGIFGGVAIPEPQRQQAKEAAMAIMMEGLLPAFLEVKKIRLPIGADVPVLDRMQPYEDFARKVWKAYKELMQRAAELLGYDIGFLYQKETRFEDGLKTFRKAHPDLPDAFEKLLRSARANWQNELAEFRNFLEHQGASDRSKFRKFYEASNIEVLFDLVWRTIVEIIAAFLSLSLPLGFRLIEQSPDDPGPRWPNRFRYAQIP